MGAALLMRKGLSGRLEPIDDAGRDLLSRVGQREVLMVEFRRPRNPQFHRKFFAMLQLVLANQEYYKSMDDLLDICKLRIGHVKSIQTKNGIEKVPASISWAAMDETGFADFYDRAVQWVLTEVIPGLKRASLDAEVENELREFAA